MTHHLQQCRGTPDTTNLTQAKTTLQHNIDNHTNQELTEVDDPGENLLADKDQDMHQGGTIATDEVRGQRAKAKLRLYFTPKTREILEFLGTAEKGEGCSREHAQGWLDYQKKKVVKMPIGCRRIFERAGSTFRRSILLRPCLYMPCLSFVHHYVFTSPLLHLLCLTLHCLAPHFVSTSPLLHLLCLPFHCHA